MGITSYHYSGGATITFYRTTSQSPESVFLDCNIACPRTRIWHAQPVCGKHTIDLGPTICRKDTSG